MTQAVTKVDGFDIAARAKAPRFKGFAGWDGNGPAADVLGAAGDNPFCGDTVEVRVRLAPSADGGGTVVADAAFDGYACSLCTAAADVLLEHAVGRPVSEVLALGYDDLLALLGGPRVGRTRSGCVRLPLTVLARALASRG